MKNCCQNISQSFTLNMQLKYFRTVTWWHSKTPSVDIVSVVHCWFEVRYRVAMDVTDNVTDNNKEEKTLLRDFDSIKKPSLSGCRSISYSTRKKNVVVVTNVIGPHTVGPKIFYKV